MEASPEAMTTTTTSEACPARKRRSTIPNFTNSSESKRMPARMRSRRHLGRKHSRSTQTKEATLKRYISHKSQFKEVTVAYETLSDPEKRRLYDKFGEEGLQGDPTPSGFGDIFDLFGMGGRGGGGGGGSRVKKGKSVLKPLKVKLEDVYNGKTAKMQITRDRICETCNGKGASKEGGVKTCDACNGRGMRTKMMQLGPGMYSQSTGPCDVCRGEGEMIKDKDRCKACKGNKVVKLKKLI